MIASAAESEKNVGRMRLSWRAFLALFGVIGLLAFACGDGSHIYFGRLFVEERECLATESALDVVEGRNVPREFAIARGEGRTV